MIVPAENGIGGPTQNNPGDLRPPTVFPSYNKKKIWWKRRTTERKAGRPPRRAHPPARPTILEIFASDPYIPGSPLPYRRRRSKPFPTGPVVSQTSPLSPPAPTQS